MSPGTRDDFSSPTKRALALRAGYQCSFTGCSTLTIGPSDEGPTAVAGIGVAAHIRAAAPGGKRYDPTMTPEERSDISNGIWLCARHGTLVDTDEVRYTVDILTAMKDAHEKRCARELEVQSARGVLPDELVAVGPDIVGVGNLLSVESSFWSLGLQHFVTGDLQSLIDYVGTFSQRRSEDRYVLLNETGDGRSLSEAPSFSREGDAYVVRCNVGAPFPRVSPTDLPPDIALTTAGDFVLENGDLLTVTGLAAFEQRVRLALITQRGYDIFYPTLGSRLLEYYSAFRGSPWLDRILKLDVIRLAAIPYRDSVSGDERTPLRCVDRVVSVDVVRDTAVSDMLPVRVEFDVHKFGRWSTTVNIGL